MMATTRAIGTRYTDADIASAIHEVLSPGEQLTPMRAALLDVLKVYAGEIFAYEGSETEDES